MTVPGVNLHTAALIDITHATVPAQGQIIDASRAPVAASHVSLGALARFLRVLLRHLQANTSAQSNSPRRP
jgi:microsomal dipeptidase-like Zn-dependent dipeptidase